MKTKTIINAILLSMFLFALLLSQQFVNIPNVNPLMAAVLITAVATNTPIIAFVVLLFTYIVTGVWTDTHFNGPLTIYLLTFGSYIIIYSYMAAIKPFIKDKLSQKTLLLTPIASLLFYILSNFGVWIEGWIGYPLTFEGLLSCYIAGLPFFFNSLMGDIFFTSIGLLTLNTLKSAAQAYQKRRTQQTI